MGNGALRYAQRELFLVGKYQIIPNPTDLAIRHLHLDPKQAFTPDLQDPRIFVLSDRNQTTDRPRFTGKPAASLHDAQARLGRERTRHGDPFRSGTSHWR
jgi:hypothetical protein